MMESPDPALERSFRGHRDRVNAVAFNPNMKQLVTASDDAADARWWTMAEIRDGVGEGTVSAGVERVVDRAEAMRSAGLLEIG